MGTDMHISNKTNKMCLNTGQETLSAVWKALRIAITSLLISDLN